jgi:simple sugar transport system ATP-binding protein
MTMTESGPPLLAMRGITKRFGPVIANDRVDLTLRAGDILGLLGENGAGKTTVMNVLFGAYAADEGRIEIGGKAVSIRSSADALALGVGMVHQHFHLVPSHTVLENLMVGFPGKGGKLDTKGARARLAEISATYSLDLDADRLVGALTIGEQQRLEIIKALYRGARILILDEPTAVLTPQEATSLFDALRAMVADGMAVVFISHKLHEVRAITNRAMIMRQGQVVANLDDPAAISEPELATLMCGHALSPPVRGSVAVGRELLRLDGVNTAGPTGLNDVSLALKGGEILGIAGVSGNGQADLANVIAGMVRPTAGQITINGAPIPRPSPLIMQRHGVGRVPEDRMTTGLITTLSLSDSMVLPWINRPPFSRFGILHRDRIRQFVNEQIEKFAIRAAGPDARTGTLSGGNLQKALLARELASDPIVLLAAQPTRGLDVAATEFVHKQFLELRERQRAVLVISEDLEELFLLSDRIAVMYEGRIVDTLPIGQASVQKIGLMMAGRAAA